MIKRKILAVSLAVLILLALSACKSAETESAGKEDLKGKEIISSEEKAPEEPGSSNESEVSDEQQNSEKHGKSDAEKKQEEKDPAVKQEDPGTDGASGENNTSEEKDKSGKEEPPSNKQDDSGQEELPDEQSGKSETSDEPDVSDKSTNSGKQENVTADITKIDEVELKEESVALSQAPAAVSTSATVSAPGTLTKQNGEAVIDYSNAKDGYVMVKYTAETDLRLKVMTKGPTTSYTYNLTPQKWEAFPLSDGNGKYQIIVYKNVSGTSYAAALALTIEVSLTDEFAPFLHSNQYVNFDSAPNTVKKAAELTANIQDPLKKVEAVYDYVVKGMTYDKALAATVKTGYLPVLDQVLQKKSGICFDYASLMTGMLRSQGVPCKLVVGYAGDAYHAWISVWSENTGWVDGVIWFDGTSWQRMDPTFASSGNASASIMAYIGDGTNYSAKYFY